MARHSLTRRQFLELCAITGGSSILAACQKATPPSPTPALTAPPVTATSSASPSPSPQPSPTATIRPYAASVAIEKVRTYEHAEIRNALIQMLDNLGGVDRLVKAGDRVAIKPNLTGGTWWDAQFQQPATELFATHPLVVQTLGELLLEAGAAEILILDGLGDEAIYQKWGYQEAAKAINARLIDLCKPDPYPSFQSFPTGAGAKVYERFFFNQSLGEIDVFISVAKMKCHSVAGVTLSLKNLFGIAPTSEYRRDPAHNNRSSFHEGTDYDPRLAQIIVDLNLARPIHFALIDGIRSVEAGAGPWDQTMSPVNPGILVGGFDPVAGDTVSTAVMGFDPTAAGGQSPFIHTDNYLTLAKEAGLGINQIEDVQVLGASIQEALFPFKPI